MNIPPTIFDKQDFDPVHKIVSFKRKENLVNKEEQREKILVTVRRNAHELLNIPSSLDLKNKNWMSEKQRADLYKALLEIKDSNGNHRFPVESITKLLENLTDSFEKLLHEEQLGDLSSGSFKNLDLILKGSETAFNQQIVIQHGIDEDLWKAFKNQVTSFAKFETDNHLSEYAERSRLELQNLDVMNIDPAKKDQLFKLMNYKLNNNLERDDFKKFYKQINSILSKNLAEESYVFQEENQSLDELARSLNADATKRSFNVAFIDDPSSEEKLHAFLESIKELANRGNKSLNIETPFSIESEGIKKVLKTLVEGLGEITSPDELKSKIEQSLNIINPFDLNRALLVNRVEREVFNNFLESQLIKSSAKAN